MPEHVLVGFGFGPIQGGLFAHEAFNSQAFQRIVVAEIDQTLVDAVRTNQGSYAVNVAQADRIEVVNIQNVELLNPTVPTDLAQLQDALTTATEIATCLPAVSIFEAGGDTSVAALIAHALENTQAKATIVYTGENNNHAAEILEEAVIGKMAAPPTGAVAFLNTVIGKMSRVVTDPEEIAALNLAPIAPGLDRAFLVEAFNHILVTRCPLDNFRPGIEVFLEKDDLLPFEEAKLYGHNAVHALLAYLGCLKGCTRMTDLKDIPALMAIGRTAFLNESGAALIKKYQHLGDELFSPAGYRHYAEDLLQRMTNPYLEDTLARAGRDPVRKLAYHDRIFGTMALALQHDIQPTNMALGALAGIAALLADADANQVPAELRGADWPNLTPEQITALCRWLWQDNAGPHAQQLIDLTIQAQPRLKAALD